MNNNDAETHGHAQWGVVFPGEYPFLEPTETREEAEKTVAALKSATLVVRSVTVTTTYGPWVPA